MTEQSVGRSDQTRESLMRAAEKLFASEGIENVSVRSIVREAGQKNESALHYHFGGTAGLIEALVDQRTGQALELRSRSIDEAMAEGRQPDVREICFLMVQAPFMLCARDRGFRDFISVFGQRLVLSQGPVHAHLQGRRDSRVREVHTLLLAQLPLLTEPLFAMRVENMTRFTMLAMSRRARSGGTFRGKKAQLFLNDLADTMAGMLMAPVSDATRAVID